MKTIYIITPSSNISDEILLNPDINKQIIKSEEFFIKINIKVLYWKLFSKSYFWYWWTIDDRINELNEWFLNNEIDYIISSQWWYNSNELLKNLDYNLIKENYKPIIWLSDITVLLNAIYKKTWKITYHGYDFIWQIWKSATNISENKLDNFLNKWLLEKSIKWEILNKNINNWKWILIWWCLPSYSLILWTEYDPIELNKDFIFFIEDIWENYERIISYIDQLLNNNKFIDNCKWFVIWNFSFCEFENKKNYDIYKIINNKLDFLNISILKISNIWHIVENPILPIWQEVEIIDNILMLNN